MMLWQPFPGMTALTEGDMKEDTISSCVNRLFDKVLFFPLPSVQGYLAYKKTPSLGPFRRPMPGVIGGS